jgi:hypothetical protein
MIFLFLFPIYSLICRIIRLIERDSEEQRKEKTNDFQAKTHTLYSIHDEGGGKKAQGPIYFSSPFEKKNTQINNNQSIQPINTTNQYNQSIHPINTSNQYNQSVTTNQYKSKNSSSTQW